MTTPEEATSAGNAIGGFFALEMGAAPGGWEPMTSSDALAEHLGAARRRLAEARGVGIEQIEPRATASIAHLGLAARLVSPALAALASAGWLPDLRLDRLQWRPGGANPVPVLWARPGGEAADGVDALARLFHERLVTDALAPLIVAVEEVEPTSPTILWGNTWSALAGGLLPLHARRPELAGRAAELVGAILERADAPGRLDAATGRFRRTTCCLYYRLPRGGLCGDCVLRPALPQRR